MRLGFGKVLLRDLTRRFGSRLAKDDKIAFMRLKMQGDFHTSVRGKFELGQRTRLAGDGIPQFRLFAGDAECAEFVLIGVQWIADKVEFGIFKMAMVVAQG